MDTADKNYLKRASVFSLIIFGTMGVMMYIIAVHRQILPVIAMSLIVGFALAALSE